MPTKSGVLYQRMLYVKQLIKQISIKHYDQVRYAEIVDEIFSRNIGSVDEYKGSSIKWRDTEEKEDVLGKESIVIEDDSVRGES